MMTGNLVAFPSPKLTLALDSWPAMEWLKEREPVTHRFRTLIERAQKDEIALLMSILNLGEVYYNSAKTDVGATPAEVLARMHELPITYVSISDEAVYAAARLKAVYSISYADAFAAQLAIDSRCSLVTGDEDFRQLERAGQLTLEWMGA